RRSSPLRTPVTSPSAAPLSLHDALPISGCAPAWSRRAPHRSQTGTAAPPRSPAQWAGTHTARAAPQQSRSHRTTLLLSYLHTPRSEEHTSELQSRFDLVCRLLLEKKNT